ncbi:DUF4410 domain-containing protein [Ramlibacter sp. MMS24-I3-19]|uniref:DUF4410 domain-containing protein n=1 Tax=Ramlibacter sp. MMS24-I3-19 TaxID=3416606 RepID=UPI003D0179ED
MDRTNDEEGPMFTLMKWMVVGTAALLLAACSGTIQRDTNGGSRRIAGSRYTAVDVVLTDAARQLQADNPQFNARELGEFVRRRLEANNLLDAQGTHRVEITIDSFRVRSAAAAVLLGIMAGTDQIDGYVRVFDARGRQVHGYKVAASYGLGGWGGGQDGMRMNWLYDRFSELTVAELAGTTDPTMLAKRAPGTGGNTVATSLRPASPPPVQPATQVAASLRPPVPVAPTQPAQPGAPTSTVPAAGVHAIASGFAAIDDVDAVPYLSERGRKVYQEWLKYPLPRAFAIAPNGYFWQTATTRPKDPDMPVDPGERALLGCERAAKRPCKLYAVNNSVVWVKEPSPLARDLDPGMSPASAVTQP